MSSSRSISKISGPVYFSYFSSTPDGKRFLFLGDYHTNETYCNMSSQDEEVHNWLYNLAKTTPTCLDIFIEDDYDVSEYVRNIRTNEILPLKDYKFPLEAVWHIFSNCVRRDKSECRLNKSRIHFVDVREIKLGSKTLTDPFRRMFYAYQYLKPDDDPHNLQKFLEPGDFPQIIKFSLGISSVKRATYKILEGLLNLTNPRPGLFDVYQEKFIDPYYDKELKILQREFSKLETPELFWEIFLKTELEYLESLFDKEKYVAIIYELSSLGMNAYTLARMLINFDTRKLGRGPEGCRNSRNSKYILFYGGSAHSKLFSHFITKYYHIIPDILINNTSPFRQCIVLDEPFDFLENIPEE